MVAFSREWAMKGPILYFSTFIQSIWPRFWWVTDALRPTFLKYSVTLHRFVRIVIQLQIWRCTCCCFAHLGPRRGRHFLSGWGLMSLICGFIVRAVIYSAVCWTALADFCEAVMTKKERAEREPSGSSLKRQRALLARVCLESDDNYM